MNDIEKRINKMIKKSEVILNAGKQTNEEWLKQCTTEQLAEFLNDCRFYFDGLKIVSAKYQDMKIEDIPLEWLKQPHKDGE